MIKLVNNDFRNVSVIQDFDCVFVDPPDNIGLGYDGIDDNLPEDEYLSLLDDLFRKCMDAAGKVWVSFNAKWTAEVGEIVSKIRREYSRCLEDNWNYKPCVQVFTFGQHNKNFLGNNHRPLWLLWRDGEEFYPDAIKVESWRQRNGDKRANAGGRVPGDVFDMQRELEDLTGTICKCSKGIIGFVTGYNEAKRIWTGYKIDGGGNWQSKNPVVLFATKDAMLTDVFDFPRITGNGKQRQDWHPTQLQEDLVERCIKFSTIPGDRVLDLCAGTGTTARVCERLGRDTTLIEKSPTYCEKLAETLGLTKLQDGCWSKK